MPEPARRTAREVLTSAAGRRLLMAVAAAGLVVSYAVAGLAGVLILLTAVTMAGVVASPARVPGAPAQPVRPRPPVPVVNAPFRSYRQVAEQLSWATVSPRHYDVVTRPLLCRLLESRLAERHGIDVHHSPNAARSLVGEDVWVWLDPARPASGSSRPPGIDPGTLHLVVDRLEAL